MLLLTSTSDLLWLEVGSNGAIDVHVSYLDVLGNPPLVTPGRRNLAIVSLGSALILPAPAASTQRNVKRVNAYNAGLAANSVVASHTDGTSQVKLASATLLPGESLNLDAMGEWHHYDANGAEYVRP